jgi:hypothetical protein
VAWAWTIGAVLAVIAFATAVIVAFAWTIGAVLAVIAFATAVIVAFTSTVGAMLACCTACCAVFPMFDTTSTRRFMAASNTASTVIEGNSSAVLMLRDSAVECETTDHATLARQPADGKGLARRRSLRNL